MKQDSYNLSYRAYLGRPCIQLTQPYTMQYNPITNELLTDNGKLLKKLHCPLVQRWETMSQATSTYKVCNTCSKAVYDTALLSKNTIQDLISNDVHACLKVNLNQQNLTITYTNHG